MIINNSISQDTDGERTERLTLLSANIDTYAVEIGYDGARLAWAQDADVAWEDARASAIVEKGASLMGATEASRFGKHDKPGRFSYHFFGNA